MVVTSRLNGSGFCGFRTALKDSKPAFSVRLLCAQEAALCAVARRREIEEIRSAELDLNVRVCHF
jgi:hypothetical protein